MFQNIKFFLNGPRRPPTILNHSKATQEWIESLDLTQPYFTAQQVCEKCELFLDALNKHVITLQLDEIEVIFQLDTPLLSLLNSLNGCYIQAAQEHRTENEREFLTQLQHLTYSALNVYEYINNQLAQHSDPWAIYAVHAEINIRLMHLYVQSMRINRYQHEAIPSIWWRKLHNTYRLAYYREWLTRSTDDRIPSIEDNFLHILLLNTLDLGGYPADLYPFIDQLLTESPSVHLLTVPPDTISTTQPIWWVDLNGDRGLQRITSSIQDNHRQNRWLDITPLVNHLSSLSRVLGEHLGMTYELQARSDLAQRLRLIEKLQHDWSPLSIPIRRVAQRRIQLEPVQWLAGIEAIEALYLAPQDSECRKESNTPSQEDLMSHLFSHGQHTPSTATTNPDTERTHDIEHRPETGYLKDMSLYGCALRIKTHPGETLAVGMLIVYRRTQQEEWCMGIIRRIRRTVRTEIEVGIEHLGSNWSVVDYLSASNHQPDTHETALYFPLDDRNSLSKKALLMPLEALDHSSAPALRLGKSLYPIAFTAILEKKRGWALLSFDVLPPTPTETRTISLAM